MPVATRLKRLRESAHPPLSIRRVADHLGKSPSSYNHYEDARRYKRDLLPVDVVRRLEGLFADHGVPREEVLALAGIDSASNDDPGGDLVPIASIDLEYGLGATFTDGHVEAEIMRFPRAWIESFTRTPSELLTFARGRGDSMQPTIHSSDMVLIDRSQRRIAEADAIWAYAIGDIGGIKRLRPRGDRVIILSDNPSVPPDEATPEEMTIIGRVIMVIRSI